MLIFNKLIRDKVPDIINKSGKSCELQALNDEEYTRYLDIKLNEEVYEYFESKNPEDLIDVVEVIYAIAKNRGISLEEFETIRNTKLQTDGGFDKRLMLMGISSKDG